MGISGSRSGGALIPTATVPSSVSAPALSSAPSGASVLDPVEIRKSVFDQVCSTRAERTTPASTDVLRDSHLCPLIQRRVDAALAGIADGTVTRILVKASEYKCFASQFAAAAAAGRVHCLVAMGIVGDAGTCGCARVF